MFSNMFYLVDKLFISIIFVTRILTRQLILGYHLARCLLLEGLRLDHLCEVNTRTEDDVRALGTEIIL